MRKLRVYTAAAWVDASRIAGMRQRLRELGFEVTAQWIDLAMSGRPYTVDAVAMAKEAKRDYGDIDKADFLILDTFGPSKGGREWEGGYAIGRGKRVMRVGPAVTPFHQLPLAFEDWDKLLSYLATRLEHADVREN